MKVGFVGLGQMGKPMALRLLQSGTKLIAMAANASAYPEMEQAGATTTRDLAEIARADVIFLSLPNGEVVAEVVRGLLEHLRPGQTIVDTSTITYSVTLEMSSAVQTTGADFVDAPVSGMEARARDGTLTVICGGKPEVISRVEPLLRCFGNRVIHMGASGSGQLAKLINQLLFDVNCAALAEILPMATKMGLDPPKVAEVVNSGTGNSYASEFFIPRILDDDFSQGYPLQHAYKDLVSAAEIGARNGIPLPVLAAATATYQLALLRGHGKSDKGSMIKVYEEALGVRFRREAGNG